MLGGQFVKILKNPVGWDRDDCDVTKYDELAAKIRNLNPLPSVIINCAAFNDVDGAEIKPDAAFKLNKEAVGNLAKIASKLDITLVHFSTNYVFDGGQEEYAENDEPRPISVYGASKAEGEKEVEKHAKKFYIIRTSVLFGPKGESELSKKSFIDLMLALKDAEYDIKAVSDETNSITYAPDLATAVERMIEDRYPYGIYHITNQGSASWYNLAQEIFSIKKIPVNVVPVSSDEFPRKAQRPKKALLLNTKFPPLRPWQEALKEYLSTVS